MRPIPDQGHDPTRPARQRRRWRSSGCRFRSAWPTEFLADTGLGRTCSYSARTLSSIARRTGRAQGDAHRLTFGSAAPNHIATGQGRAAAALGLSVLALLTFGFVMLTSTSSFYVYHVHSDAFYYAKRQPMWLGLGLAACLATSRADYHCYRKGVWPLLILAVGVIVVGGLMLV